MRYINRKTGTVIEVECRISGGDWEAVDTENSNVEGNPGESDSYDSAQSNGDCENDNAEAIPEPPEKIPRKPGRARRKTT
jgi:hypothetical protein